MELGLPGLQKQNEYADLDYLVHRIRNNDRQVLLNSKL
jgi:hypothetical protein